MQREGLESNTPHERFLEAKTLPSAPCSRRKNMQNETKGCSSTQTPWTNTEAAPFLINIRGELRQIVVWVGPQLYPEAPSHLWESIQMCLCPFCPSAVLTPAVQSAATSLAHLAFISHLMLIQISSPAGGPGSQINMISVFSPRRPEADWIFLHGLVSNELGWVLDPLTTRNENGTFCFHDVLWDGWTSLTGTVRHTCASLYNPPWSRTTPKPVRVHATVALLNDHLLNKWLQSVEFWDPPSAVLKKCSKVRTKCSDVLFSGSWHQTERPYWLECEQARSVTAFSALSRQFSWQSCWLICLSFQFSFFILLFSFTVTPAEYTPPTVTMDP